MGLSSQRKLVARGLVPRSNDTLLRAVRRRQPQSITASPVTFLLSSLVVDLVFTGLSSHFAFEFVQGNGEYNRPAVRAMTDEFTLLVQSP
jgi:hypothetical protein